MEFDFSIIANSIYDRSYCIVDGFLSQDEINDVLLRIKQLKAKQSFKNAGIGNQENLQVITTIRNDLISWINEEDALFQSVFFPKTNSIISELNRRCFLGLKEHEFHLAFYGPGSFYKKHRDAFSNDDARKISVICYLNKNWQPTHGGELKLYFENSEPLTIEPLAGRLVVFESHLEHEVLQSNNDRYSITGWLKNKSRLV